MADDSAQPTPALRNAQNQSDKLGRQFLKATDKIISRAQSKAPDGDHEKKPAGGWDGTSIPRAPPGYTLKFTFHRAINLPFADVNDLSSDPYLIATLQTTLRKRHEDDPELRLRIPTIRRNVNPEWNAEWIVAHVPADGFSMKCRIYDEDPADHDDRLGNVHVYEDKIGDGWPGFKEKSFVVQKRSGSKRAYFFRGAAAMIWKDVKMNAEVIISVESLGRSEDEGGRCYTIAPLAWSRHFSPMIGRLTGTTDVDEDEKGVKKYNFQAVQLQLRGPVPEHLYHRFVEFKPFVAGMFTDHSLRGRVLNKALHHQHARIYNYDGTTLYGKFSEPCIEMTKLFLDFVHYDQGGRIFTYVITLDAQWRFTETGKEFGIDMLSKHTMHSDVNSYIAFSGEFFIRKLKHPQAHNRDLADLTANIMPPTPDPENESEKEMQNPSYSKDPLMYQLVIDNDSGTYRPNAKYLHTLKAFLSKNLPGLHVVTLDCQADAEKMGKLKDEQRELKKATGKQLTYLQNKSTSSISSSEESQLDERAGVEHPNKFQQQMQNMKEKAAGLKLS